MFVLLVAVFLGLVIMARLVAGTCNGDQIVNGTVIAQGLQLSTGTITPEMMSKSRLSFDYSQGNGAAVAAETGKTLHIVRGATGTIKAFQAAITGTIATGGDRTVTIDLKKSTGGGAFASVLSATIVFNSSSTLLTVTAATISSAGLVAGDILEVTVAVAGVAGNQALGLAVTLTIDEAVA